MGNTTGTGNVVQFATPTPPQWVPYTPENKDYSKQDLRKEVMFFNNNVRAQAKRMEKLYAFINACPCIQTENIPGFEESYNIAKKHILKYWLEMSNFNTRRCCKIYMRNLNKALETLHKKCSCDVKHAVNQVTIPSKRCDITDHTRDVLLSPKMYAKDTRDRLEKLQNEYDDLVEEFGEEHALCQDAAKTLNKLQENWRNQGTAVSPEILVTFPIYEKASIKQRKERTKQILIKFVRKETKKMNRTQEKLDRVKKDILTARLDGDDELIAALKREERIFEDYVAKKETTIDVHADILRNRHDYIMSQ